MDIFDGRIVVSADDFEEVAYGIEQITAIFEEDINDVIVFGAVELKSRVMRPQS